jgi:hypothetical protein
MPTTRYIDKGSLAPEDIRTMVEADESACRELSVAYSHPYTELVAKEVVTLAKKGERDVPRTAPACCAGMRRVACRRSWRKRH